LLDYSDELLDRIRKKGNLFRVLDHGDASPTCCLWFAAIDGVYICYREYYVPNNVISYHRRSINELSGNESYSGNYADPQIFKTTAQKAGGFWSVADEYLTNELESKALAWIPADNNEFATRNRINELLSTRDGKKAQIFFIKRSESYLQGCFYTINELQSQRRKLLGYVDGTAQYCDDREESVADHAYDCVRYFVAMHGLTKHEPSRPIKSNTFNYFKMMKLRAKSQLMAASTGHD
jgi:hypothetical protein